jgi:hypothetical protein
LAKFVEKGFIYGLVLGFCIGVFFVPYKEVLDSGEGFIETSHMELIDVFMVLMRICAASGLSGAGIGYYLYVDKMKHSK